MDNGSINGFHSASRSPVSSFIENAFPHRSSSVPNNLPSPVGVASIGKQFGLCESNHSLNEMKFANQCIPGFHPHSFPEYNDSLANAIPCNSSSNIADMAVNLGPRMTEGIDSRQIRRANSNIHPVELNGGGKLIILPVVWLKHLLLLHILDFGIWLTTVRIVMGRIRHISETKIYEHRGNVGMKQITIYRFSTI